MGSVLDALHHLQSIELQLATIRQTRGAKARQLQIFKRKVEQAKQRLQESRRKCREHQVKLDALGLDIAAREETINKHRQALAQAKTNREYAAILTAMNTEKADNAKLESALLQLMETMQTLQEEMAEIEVEEVKLCAKVAATEEALKTFDLESEQGRRRLEADREACAENIPPAPMAAFNRIAERHDGEALAAIARLSSKRQEYVCSGCNMKVTLEIINSLQTRDEIQTCSVCGRLLYLDASVAAE